MWVNSWTEVEPLGGGRFAASVHVGHRVFRDKADGQWKKHKLTDERPVKGCVLVQSAKCCVEVYPWYAKYFDVQHEEIRLNEERWVVQRLIQAPDAWMDVDAHNPVMAVEETENSIVVTVNYTTDYGTLVVKYIQRDGAALKHDIAFKNTSGSTETFRALQRWAGIVGVKCSGKDVPVDVDEPFLAFHRADKPQGEFTIAENLGGMIFNPDGSEKTEKCLQKPVRVEAHAQGMKADFIYGNWILTQNESLTIDPDTATLSNPTEDGYIFKYGTSYGRDSSGWSFCIGYDYEGPYIYRAYVEWSVSSIPDTATITDTVFKYNGYTHTIDCHIHAIASQPSVQTNNDAGNQIIYDDVADGTVYADVANFPVAATNQQIDLGATADTDLQNSLVVNWFAIGIQGDSENVDYDAILSEEQIGATPPPTLYVEYKLPTKPASIVPLMMTLLEENVI